MTPLMIQMMLHYYAICKPYASNDPAHANSIAVSQQRYRLYKLGLLIPGDGPSGWYPTKAGCNYIDRLKEVPAIVA